MNAFDVPQDVLRTPATLLRCAVLPMGTPATIEFVYSEQFRAHYDPAQRAMWSRWNPSPRPCFNVRLLADIRAYHDFLAQSEGQIEHLGVQNPLEYVVLASEKPGVFNLGGDLDLFKKLIGDRDRDELLRYGRACIDVL